MNIKPSDQNRPNVLVKPGKLSEQIPQNPESKIPSPFNKQELSSHSPLSESKSVAFLPTPTPTQTKTDSYAKQFFNYVANRGASAYRYVANGGTLVICKVVENTIFSPKAIKTAHEENLGQLEEMTGDAKLGEFLDQVSEMMTTILTKKFGEEGFIKRGIAQEGAFLQQLIESMVTKLAVNIGKRLQEENKEVSLIAIAGCAATLVIEEMEAVGEEIKRAKEIKDSKQRAAALNTAALPAVDTLLKLAFPEGAKELPLNSYIQNYAWSYLRKTVLPEMLLDWHLLSQGISDLSRIELLNSQPEHEFLGKAALEARSMIQKQGPVLLSDSKVVASIATFILKELPPAQEGKENPLASWLISQVQKIGQTEDVIAFCKFLGGKASSIVSYVLFNLAKSDNLNEEGSLSIAANLLEQITLFDGIFHLKIEKIYQKLNAKGITPENSPEYIECFVPLAKMFEDIAGLNVLKSLLPDFLREKLIDVRDNEASKALALIYREYLSPVIGIYRQLQDSQVWRQTDEVKSLPNGKALSEQIERVSEFTLDKISEYLTKNHRDISEKVCGALFQSVPILRARKEITSQPETARKLPRIEDRKSVHIFNIDRFPIVDPRGFGAVSDAEVIPLPALKSNPEAKIQDKNGDKEANSNEKIRTFEDWVRSCLDGKILMIDSSSAFRGVNISELIKNATGGILEYVILHLSKQSREISNVPNEILNKFLNCLRQFIQQYGPEIQEDYIRLCKSDIAPQDDLQFVQRFTLLCKDMLDQFGLNLETAVQENSFFGVMFRKNVLEQMPKLLAAQYRECLVPEEAINLSKRKLEEFLISSSSTDLSLEPVSVLRQIDHLGTILAKKIVPAIKEMAFEELGEIAGRSQNGLNETGMYDAYLQNIVKSLLMQALVNYLERLKAEEGAINKISPSKFLGKIAKTLARHLKSDASAIQKAASTLDPSQQKLALRAAFLPLSNSLIALMTPLSNTQKGEMPFEIPFGNLLGGIWLDVQTLILPDVLVKMYMDTTVWIKEAETSKEKIVKETGTNYIPEACRLLGQWTSEFLPAMLFSDREDFSQDIYEAAQEFLVETGDIEGLSVEEFIKKHEILIKKSLCEDIFSFFAPDTELTAKVKPLNREIMKGAFFKVFSNLTKKINEVQGRDSKEQKEFMLGFGIKFLKVVNEHFIAVNKTTAATKKYTAHKVPHKDLIEGFGEQLHEGVPQTPGSIKAHQTIKEALGTIKKENKLLMKLKDPVKQKKCRERIKAARNKLKEAKKIQSEERVKFFKPLTENLMQLAGVTKAEDLPVPSAVRELVWKKFQNELLPAVLEKIFAEMIDPASRTKMAVAGLKALNEALDAIPDPNVEEEKIEEDGNQRKLNKVCGELVLELVQLVPRSMIKAAFKLSKVQELSAEMVGKAVRRYLGDELNLLKLIDKGIVEGISTLYPGQWTQEGRLAEFKEDSQTLDFPLNEEELEAEEIENMLKEDLEAKQMRKMMIETTHRVISESITNFFSMPLLKIKLVWNACVDKVFGKYSQSVRDFFDYIGSKAVFRLIEAFFEVLSIPFRRAFWLFMDLHIGYKVDHVIKSLQLDIHENLLYQLTDQLIAVLKEGKKGVDKTEMLQPILEAAEERDKKEKMEVLQYIERLGLKLVDIQTLTKKRPAHIL